MPAERQGDFDVTELAPEPPNLERTGPAPDAKKPLDLRIDELDRALAEPLDKPK